MVQWTMLDLRNAISPNRAARAPRQALRSFRPGCQDPGPGRPPGKTSREDIPGRPGVYTHTPNSTVFSTISTKYRAGPRSGSRVSAPGAVVAARRLRRARVRPLPSPACVGTLSGCAGSAGWLVAARGAHAGRGRRPLFQPPACPVRPRADMLGGPEPRADPGSDELVVPADRLLRGGTACRCTGIDNGRFRV